MKKAFLIILAISTLLCLCISFSACNEAENPNTGSTVPSQMPSSSVSGNDTSDSSGESSTPAQSGEDTESGDFSSPSDQGSADGANPSPDDSGKQDSDESSVQSTDIPSEPDNANSSVDAESSAKDDGDADSSSEDSSLLDKESEIGQDSSTMDSSTQETVVPSWSTVGSSAQGTSSDPSGDSSDEDKIRYTITEKEWAYNLYISNYRVDIDNGTLIYNMASNGMEIIAEGYSMLVIYENGYTYSYISIGSGYIPEDKQETEPYVGRSIGALLFENRTVPFSALEYNEAKKCYILNGNEVRFENGLLISIAGFVFSDHNCVELKRPESADVTVPLAPSDFDSTLERDEWEAMFETDNFTATLIAGDANGSLVYTKDGAYLNYGGVEMYIVPKNGRTYALISNPITGKTSVSLYEHEYSLASLFFDGVITKDLFDSLEFNEEKGCFTVSVTTPDNSALGSNIDITYEFYFIDGIIIYVKEVRDDASELTEFIKIGQTQLEIPDFTPPLTQEDIENWPSAEKPTVSEEEWEAAFLKDNLKCAVFSEEQLIFEYTITKELAKCYDSLLVKRNGKLYSVFEYERNLYGVLVEGSAEINLNTVLFGIIDYSSMFNSARYDSEKGAYTLIREAEDESEELVIYFDNGLISMIYTTVTSTQTGESYSYAMVFSGYGEVEELTAPEFEIIELN